MKRAGTVTAAEGQNRPALGVALNSLSFFLVSASDAFGKYLVALLPVGQLLALRSIFALLFLVPALVLAARHGWGALQVHRYDLHLIRAVTMIVSVVAFFEAMRVLDLAKLTAIMFATPIFVALFSGPLIRERVSLGQWLAIGLGFAGTVIVLDPGSSGISYAEGLALVSAATWALGQILLRKMTATEHPLAILASFNVLVLPFYLALAAFSHVAMSWTTVAAVAVMATAQVGAQLFGALAFRVARAATVAPVQYSQMIWATLFGWLFWNVLPVWRVLLGGLIVIGAGLLLVYVEGRRSHQAARRHD
jgi:drug/metabolite transporter (DMT)-like permease